MFCLLQLSIFFLCFVYLVFDWDLLWSFFFGLVGVLLVSTWVYFALVWGSLLLWYCQRSVLCQILVFISPSFLPGSQKIDIVLLFLYAPILCFLTIFFFVYFIETLYFTFEFYYYIFCWFIPLESFPLGFLVGIFSFSILSSFWSIFSSMVLFFLMFSSPDLSSIFHSGVYIFVDIIQVFLLPSWNSMKCLFMSSLNYLNFLIESMIVVLVRVSTIVKWHHNHSNSYKEKLLTGGGALAYSSEV